MPEEDLRPYPSQAEADEMVVAAAGLALPLGQPVLVAREGEDLTPVMTQTQNDVAMLIACGPPPGSYPPQNIDVPFVAGTAAVGGTLNCTMGNWTGEPTSYAYQWQSDGAPVGTSDADYVVAAGDAGHSMTCVVTAMNDNGSTAAPPSNAVLVNGAAATSARRRG